MAIVQLIFPGACCSLRKGTGKPEGGCGVMEELKRCPFCGGEAETRCSVAYAGYVYDGYVECLECGSRTPIYYTKAEAIAAWNRRVEG